MTRRIKDVDRSLACPEEGVPHINRDAALSFLFALVEHPCEPKRTLALLLGLTLVPDEGRHQRSSEVINKQSAPVVPDEGRHQRSS